MLINVTLDINLGHCCRVEGFAAVTQLEPDIKIANNPETVINGEDLQLKAAVEELMRECGLK